MGHGMEKGNLLAVLTELIRTFPYVTKKTCF